MGHSQAEKSSSRERILKQAAEQIREAGLESVSVNKLMRSVNLTHGGFYGHFGSRSELVAQALERALLEGEVKSSAIIDAGKPRGFAAMVKSYLSRGHRDAPKTGCALATLATDVARADEQARGVMSSHIDSYIANLSHALEQADDDQAMVVLSTLVGALTLSRVMTDPVRSDAMLRAAREHVIAMRPDGAAT